MKIVADDKIPFLKGVFEPYADVSYLPGGKISKADLAGADALLVRTRTRCDASLLDGTPVKAIATATIGFDHIDTAYCESKGIFWTNAPGCNSASVAQYITASLLTLSLKTGVPLHGSTLGVVGVGNVGSKVAEVGKALGLKVLLNDPPRKRKGNACWGEIFLDLETLLAESDFLTLHVPLTHEGPDKTFHLGDADFFKKLARKPVLINSSRGEVVSGDALKEALRKGLVRAAALDVWENEPDIDLELLGMLSQATPHIAGYSTDGKANGTMQSVRAIAKMLSLPLINFVPSGVPAPKSPVIEIEEAGTFEETLLRAVSISYDVRKDDARLRANPSEFEKQRGSYPLRREFPAYRLKAHVSEEAMKALSGLGFSA